MDGCVKLGRSPFIFIRNDDVALCFTGNLSVSRRPGGQIRRWSGWTTGVDATYDITCCSTSRNVETTGSTLMYALVLSLTKQHHASLTNTFSVRHQPFTETYNVTGPGFDTRNVTLWVVKDM